MKKKRYGWAVSILLILMGFVLSGCSNVTASSDEGENLNNINNSVNGGYIVETPDGNYFLSDAEGSNILYKIEDEEVVPVVNLTNEYSFSRPCMNYYDGKIILYLSEKTYSALSHGIVLSVDLESGDQEIILETGLKQIYIIGDQMFYLSLVTSDSSNVKYPYTPVLRVYDLKTGEDRELLHPDGVESLSCFFELDDRIYFAYSKTETPGKTQILSVFDLDGNEIQDDPIVDALSDYSITSVQVDSNAIYFTGYTSSENILNGLRLYRLSLDDMTVSTLYDSDQYHIESFGLKDDYILVLGNNYVSSTVQVIRMNTDGEDQYIYTKRPENLLADLYGKTSFQATSEHVYLYEVGATESTSHTQDTCLYWISLEDLGLMFQATK